MLKNKTILEVKIGDNTYQLECLPTAPVGELHDALITMKSFVLQIMIDQQKRDEESKIIDPQKVKE